MHEFNITCFI